MLCELGHLSEEHLSEALAHHGDPVTRARPLFGELLLSRGLIDEKTLRHALREQLGRKVRYAAAMPPHTAFAFYDRFDALANWGREAVGGIDPVRLMWSALTENTPWEHVQSVTGRVLTSSLRLSRSADLARFSAR